MVYTKIVMVENLTMFIDPNKICWYVIDYTVV